MYRSALEKLQHTVTTSEQLADLASRLQDSCAIGLDTEFLRERTYRAQLALLQVASNGEAICVDPLAIADLTPLVPALTASPAVKIMHASRQDLEVLYPAIGLVRPVFDTQIAAALIGLPAQVGYGELVRRLLDVTLPKSHTRTDWIRRPLSPEQIEYALDDVRFLAPLKERLEEELGRLGRLTWLIEELGTLADARNFAPDPERAWLRIKGLRGLDPPRTELARTLAAWRERRAIERNRPRGWILDDVSLREIVLLVPRTPEALGQVPELAAGVVKHSAEEILALIEAAHIPDPPPPVDQRIKPDPVQVALVKRLAQTLQTAAAELDLSPEILVTRRDLEQLAQGRRDIAALSGWRRAVIGERLLVAL